MTEQIGNFLAALYFLRWIIVAVVVVALGLLYADALAALHRERAARLKAENDWLRLWRKTQGPVPRRGRPVVARPPRQDRGGRRG